MSGDSAALPGFLQNQLAYVAQNLVAYFHAANVVDQLKALDVNANDVIAFVAALFQNFLGLNQKIRLGIKARQVVAAHGVHCDGSFAQANHVFKTAQNNLLVVRLVDKINGAIFHRIQLGFFGMSFCAHNNRNVRRPCVRLHVAQKFNKGALR